MNIFIDFNAFANVVSRYNHFGAGMFSHFILMLGLLWSFVFCPQAFADAPKVDFSTLSDVSVVKQSDRSGNPHPVVARLIADSKTVQPGVPFRLGVHLTM